MNLLQGCRAQFVKLQDHDKLSEQIITSLLNNKFLDVLWFLNIYYYELSTASLQSSTGGLQLQRTSKNLL